MEPPTDMLLAPTKERWFGTLSELASARFHARFVFGLHSLRPPSRRHLIAIRLPTVSLCSGQ